MKIYYYDKMLKAIRLYEKYKDGNQNKYHKKVFKLIPFFEKEKEENYKIMKKENFFEKYCFIMIFERYRNLEDYLRL